MKDESTITLTMANYTKKMVEFMGLEGDHHSHRPVDYPFRMNIDQDDDEEDLTSQERTTFMTGLGMLGWLVSCIRADLAYTYSMIASSMARPTKRSMRQLIWATRYLKGTSTLGGVTSKHMNQGDTMWRHFCDSDQGRDQSMENKGRARCGQISLANGFPVFFKSKAISVAMAHPKIKNGHADVSSGACEIYGAAQATFNILFLNYCSEEMGVEFNLPFILEMDNKAAEVFVNDTAMNTKMRHIDQRQHWVQTIRDSRIVKAKHVSTTHNLADIFTKPLQGPTFKTLRDSILHDCTEICLQGGIKMLNIKK